MGHIFRVIDGPILSDIQPGEKKYPIPYSEAFYADLVDYQYRLTDLNFAKQLTDKYLLNKVVVLIERENLVAEADETAIFVNLTASTNMKDLGLKLLSQNNGLEIKVIGSLGIYIFDQADLALDFATAFRQELTREGVICRIGIDAGLVLVFDLAEGGKDIAGSPVNIASKISQDKGEFGKLYLSESMKDFLDVSQFTEIKYTVSGVEITAYQN
jgi:hypothetical protein